jgi:predicted kinase
MLVAMAGLPGTGKTALARRLAQELDAILLNKDVVRAVLFPPAVLDYSSQQDHICIQAIFAAAGYILRTSPQKTVILDGRTFLRAGQIQELLVLATSLQQRPYVIECVCADEVARERLQRDLAGGQHPAGNRTFALYRALKEKAEPIPLPHLIVDTEQTSLEEGVAQCLEYLRSPDHAAAAPRPL